MLTDAFVSPSLAPLPTAVVSVGDPAATRTVYTTVVLLAGLGLVLVALAVWLLRRTRPEPELLAPLETMDTRGWRKLDPAARRRALDDSRPAGALPLRREASEPVVDESFAKMAPVASFDDLSDREDHAVLSPAQHEDLAESVVLVDDDDPEVRNGDDASDVPVALAETSESERIVAAEDDQIDHVPESDEDTDEIERDQERGADEEPDERSIDPLLISKRAPTDRNS